MQEPKQAYLPSTPYFEVSVDHLEPFAYTYPYYMDHTADQLLPRIDLFLVAEQQEVEQVLLLSVQFIMLVYHGSLDLQKHIRL